MGKIIRLKFDCLYFQFHCSIFDRTGGLGWNSLKISNHKCPILYVKRIFICMLIFVIGFNLGNNDEPNMAISHGVRNSDLIVGLHFGRRIYPYILGLKN